MPAKDLGVKYVCLKCGTKFYDLKKPNPVCPKCGTDQRESPAPKASAAAEKRSRAPARAAAQPVEDPEIEAEPELEEELDEAEDDPAATDDE